MEIAEVLTEVRRKEVKRLTITGGEPLLQKEDVLNICRTLIRENFSINIETGGSVDISGIPPDVRIVMDIKTPGSGMSPHMKFYNIDLLRPGDEIKFVITSRADYEWSLNIAEKYSLLNREVLFSPAVGRLDPTLLAEWLIKEKRENIRFQLQLHSILWPGQKGK